jgi:RNase P/RNase MRP subunit POP5
MRRSATFHWFLSCNRRRAKQVNGALVSLVKRRHDDAEDALEVVALSGEIKEVRRAEQKVRHAPKIPAEENLPIVR